MKTLLMIALLANLTVPAMAEAVDVKYVGSVDLQTYECQEVTRSSLVNRVCYDESASSMIVLLRSTYYSYCRVPTELIDAFHSAESMGRFYNQNIKSDATEGLYACN